MFYSLKNDKHFITIEGFLKDFSQRVGSKKTFILDVGCGEGEKLKYFLKDGFEAVALDKSKENIKTALKRISKYENVEFIVADIKDLKFRKNVFDLIIAVGVLHPFPRSRALNIISRMKMWTKSGGYNVVSIFRKGEHMGDRENECIYPFNEGELKEIYSDWEIEHYQEFSFTDMKHGKPHIHHVSQVMAKKD